MMSAIKTWIGILRSRIIYYGKPFNKRKLRRFYGGFIKANDLCFDIGAHVGNRSLAFQQLGARVVAVEPQPKCVNFLQRLFKNDNQVSIEPIAIGARPGKATFHISHLFPTISTLADESWRHKMKKEGTFNINWEEQMEVTVSTLDELIQKYGLPKFCKIDVEGFEVDVLQGLSQAIPVLSFEFISISFPKVFDCLDLLDKLGSYEYNWSEKEELKFKSNDWLDSRKIREVFLHYPKKLVSGDIYARLQ